MLCEITSQQRYNKGLDATGDNFAICAAAYFINAGCRCKYSRCRVWIQVSGWQKQQLLFPSRNGVRDNQSIGSML